MKKLDGESGWRKIIKNDGWKNLIEKNSKQKWWVGVLIEISWKFGC